MNDFLNKYKSSCPPSRTVKEAQKYVAETYGKRFTLKGDKPLGVGTIAETFLAKDNETGNDVVIKMVKKWVSLDKLKKDKESMLKSLERMKDKIKPDEYDYQRKLVDDCKLGKPLELLFLHEYVHSFYISKLLCFLS